MFCSLITRVLQSEQPIKRLYLFAFCSESREHGSFLQCTTSNPEGVPLISKELKEVQLFVELGAQSLWSTSHMPPHLIDPDTEEFVLRRGDQFDEEMLLLISCFK